MSIEEHVALAPYTTFKIGGNARYFCSVHTEDELVEAVSFAQKNSLRTLIMGGGSNMLVSDKGFDGLVINVNIKGITVMGETISVQAGEVWDEFVFYAVSNAMYGFENLSAIPGTVGAAPVQNIGAYGTEVAEVIQAVRVFDVSSMKFIELSNKECAFAYRDSLFKHHKGRYIITRVDFVCRKNGAVNIEYKDLKQYFLDHPHNSGQS